MASEYDLIVRGKMVGVEVQLNGLPLLILEEGGQVPSAKINYLVIPGQNKVSLRIFLPAGRPRLRSEAQATLRISKNGQEQTALEWGAAPTDPTLPPELHGAFEASEAFGAWEWQSAPPLASPPTDIEGLHTLMKKLHRALSSKDTDGVLNLLSLKNREMARSFGVDPSRAEADQRHFFTDLFSSPDWAMEPLALERARYVLYGDRRCVHPLTHDDQELLQTKPDADGAVFSLPVLISHLRTGWTIVR